MLTVSTGESLIHPDLYNVGERERERECWQDLEEMTKRLGNEGLCSRAVEIGTV